MDLQDVGWGGTNWIDLVQDRGRWPALVNAVMNLRVPQNAEMFLTGWGPVSFSRRIPLHGLSLLISDLVIYLVSDCVGSHKLSTMYVLKLIQQQMKMCKRIVIPHVLVPVLSAIANKPLCVPREKNVLFSY
jgi:hypothetical protein